MPTARSNAAPNPSPTDSDALYRIASSEKDPMQFTRQVDHFSDCILHDRIPNTPGETGLADQLALKAIYKSAGITL